jgi:hypothetical protein
MPASRPVLRDFSAPGARDTGSTASLGTPVAGAGVPSTPVTGQLAISSSIRADLPGESALTCS